MDASWNTISTDPAVLQDIANNLGYPSVDQLPPLGSLSPNQVATLVVEFANQAGNNQKASTGDYTNPQLDPADVPTDARTLGMSLQQATARISNLMLQYAEATASQTQDDIKTRQEDRVKQIQKSLKKLKSAAKSGKASRILGWIGASAGVVAAMAAVVVTGGAAAPLLVVAIAGLLLQVSQETGLTDKALQGMFGNDQEAKMWFMIGLAAFMLIMGLASGAYAANAGPTTTLLVTQLSSAFNTSTQAVQATAQGFALTTAVIGALAGLGTGAAQVNTAVTTYEATQDQQRAKELQAWLQKLQSYLQESQNDIKKIIDRYTQIGVKLANDLLDAGNESYTNVLQSSPA